jgi:hypothetical protein
MEDGKLKFPYPASNYFKLYLVMVIIPLFWRLKIKSEHLEQAALQNQRVQLLIADLHCRSSYYPLSYYFANTECLRRVEFIFLPNIQLYSMNPGYGISYFFS